MLDDRTATTYLSKWWEDRVKHILIYVVMQRSHIESHRSRRTWLHRGRRCTRQSVAFRMRRLDDDRNSEQLLSAQSERQLNGLHFNEFYIGDTFWPVGFVVENQTNVTNLWHQQVIVTNNFYGASVYCARIIQWQAILRSISRRSKG